MHSPKDSDMFEHIRSTLRDLAIEEDVRVLYAVESGSRAWGFASDDSDWDVRFLYVRRPEWYLSIDPGRDVIERMLPRDLDLAGWDLPKALKLFRKSNPPLMEWLDSPIVYAQSGETATRMRAMREACFRPEGGLHHYLSMARGNAQSYLRGPTVKRKKYLYVLRPLLACAWIEARQTMAPISFEQTLNAMLPSGEVRDAIDALVEAKKKTGELGEGEHIAVLDAWIEARLAHHEASPPPRDPQADDQTDALNELFRASLREAWM